MGRQGKGEEEQAACAPLIAAAPARRPFSSFRCVQTHDTLSSRNTTRPSSAAQSQPRSALTSATPARPAARSSTEDLNATPSEASRAAAQEALAAVRKDGGSVTVPAAPIGLHSFGGAAGAASASAGAPAAAAAGAPTAAGGLPGAPTGLAALNAAAMANMQATLFGMGAAPVTKEVALVTVPRLDDLIIKALADNYHSQ